MSTSTLASSKPFDPTKSVQTRDGRKVRIICTDRKGTEYPVLALVTKSEGDKESFETYTPEGGYLLGASTDDMDLVNIPEPAVVTAARVNGFDPTKPVQTRDGRKARILATDLNNRDGDTIVAVVDGGDGYDYTFTYRPDGRYVACGENERDLINVPESVTHYVHVLPAVGAGGFTTKDCGSWSEPNTSQTIGVLKVTVTGDKIEAVQVH